MTGRPSRLAWFAGLYLGSVGLLAIAAQALKAALHLLI
jgi:hypothetical protein